MDKDKALKLALEALNTPRPTDSYPPLWRSYEKTINDAITAIKQALALDKKAENARELGLDYEPVQDVSLIDEGKTAAQPAPVQEPVACSVCGGLGTYDDTDGSVVNPCDHCNGFAIAKVTRGAA